MIFFILIFVLFKISFSLENCGLFFYAKPTIGNGVVASRGQFPYLFPLILKETNKKFCGANLISNGVALTGI